MVNLISQSICLLTSPAEMPILRTAKPLRDISDEPRFLDAVQRQGCALGQQQDSVPAKVMQYNPASIGGSKFLYPSKARKMIRLEERPRLWVSLMRKLDYPVGDHQG